MEYQNISIWHIESIHLPPAPHICMSESAHLFSRRQAIIWTNDGIISWHICASLSLNELISRQTETGFDSLTAYNDLSTRASVTAVLIIHPFQGSICECAQPMSNVVSHWRGTFTKWTLPFISCYGLTSWHTGSLSLTAHNDNYHRLDMQICILLYVTWLLSYPRCPSCLDKKDIHY